MFGASLDDLLGECERLHGHLCPGQLLGVRMALLGCRLLGIEDPRGADRKKLLVWVEIDRCMTDAVSAVTGARLGRRSLKFIDLGKVAATFLNLETGKAVRVAALDEARELADRMHSEIPDRRERQMLAYRKAAAEEIFKIESVEVRYTDFDLPGRPRARVTCIRCSEGVNDGREIQTEAGPLCKACASGGYYIPISVR
jgi:formylmethanofuran dehydrogenase subunit E